MKRIVFISQLLILWWGLGLALPTYVQAGAKPQPQGQLYGPQERLEGKTDKQKGTFWKKLTQEENEPLITAAVVLAVLFILMLLFGLPGLLALTQVAWIFNSVATFTGLLGATSVGLGIAGLRKLKKQGKKGKRKAWFAILAPLATVVGVMTYLYIALRDGW
ncbi:MAG: hypothetical protein AAFP92_10670 [Bacteroidota bacterium]